MTVLRIECDQVVIGFTLGDGAKEKIGSVGVFGFQNKNQNMLTGLIPPAGLFQNLCFSIQFDRNFRIYIHPIIFQERLWLPCQAQC